jgi:hypothetical protein
VALVSTDVSEEHTASTIRVTRIRKLGTSAVTSNLSSSPILVTLMMVAIRYFRMSVLTRATRRNIPQDGILHLRTAYAINKLLKRGHVYHWMQCPHIHIIIIIIIIINGEKITVS